MKNTKLFSFIGIFTFLILSLSLVSAAVEYTPTELTGTGDQGATATINLNLENDYSSDLNTITAVFSDLISGSNTIASSNLNIPSIDSSTVIADRDSLDVVVEVSIPSSQAIGTYTGEVEFFGTLGSGNDQSRGTVNITLEVTPLVATDSFCEDGPLDTADLTLNVDIKNKGEGAEDDEWLPLDKIEVEVEIENDGSEDMDNVILELGLFEEGGSSKNIADEMLWISEDDEKIKIGDVDEDDEEKHTFIFRVDPDIEEGDYILKVKAYPKGDEDIQCIDSSDDLKDFGDEDTYAKIQIEREDVNDERAIIVDVGEIDMPYEVNCGQTIMLVADIYNIADEDQEQVKITLRNSELGIDLTTEIREDLDMGDKEQITFTFEIPENAEEKEYFLEFRTYYDYDDDDGAYDEFSDAFTKHIKVAGSCIGTEPTITATLLSDAKLGEDLIVKVTVTNNGKSEENFVIDVQGTETWAEIVDVSPQILTISQGSIDTATITLKPTQTGTHTFDVVLIYSGQEVTQSVSVSIEEEAGFMTGAFAGLNKLGDTGLYAVAGIFLVLVIIILVLIVKVAKAPKAAEF